VRTTIDIDDDVLQAARELARRERKTLGQAISGLARIGLHAPTGSPQEKEPAAVHGFRPFASRGGVVTNALIGRLREDDAN
jgi:hypothetical protein